MVRIGIDIGGTFTDFVVWGTQGNDAVRTFKVSSTPPHFDRAVISGFEKLLASGAVSPSDEILAVHGTTVSTNTIIERTGEDIALCVTEGFRDLLNIQRLRLDKPVELFNARAKPLIPREHVFPVRERLDGSGRVIEPLDEAAVVQLAGILERQGIRHVVVSFIHGYRNPVHEIRAREIFKTVSPGLTVTLGSEIWRQQAEYERTILAVLNAYVQRRISTYIESIEAYLAGAFPKARLFITRSNGGLMSAREACGLPVHTLLSGPASGVSAAAFLARQSRGASFLTMDMGGTSTDLSLIRNGEPLISTDGTVGDFPLYMPMTGIEAIGAGGGSIASIDGPVLTLGPRSAGASPGPACYSRGGTEATLTDAYLLCGYIDPGTFLGGQMPLDPTLAKRAVGKVADRLGLDPYATAEACIEVATSNMAAKALPFLARAGADPVGVSLMAFGGAGPLHACFLAEELGIQHVLVPGVSSVFCAYGGTVSPLIHDLNETIQGVTLSGEALRDIFAALRGDAAHWLSQQADPGQLAGADYQHVVEARYVGQSFNVAVQVPQVVIEQADIDAIKRLFHDEHERLYSHADRDAAVDLIQARIRVLGRMEVPGPDMRVRRAEEAKAQSSSRRCLFGGEWLDARVIDLEMLGNEEMGGPGMIDVGDTTVVVPPGWQARLANGSIDISRTAR